MYRKELMSGSLPSLSLLVCLVEIYKLCQAGVSFLRFRFGLREQSCCTFRISTLQRVVTYFAHDEVFIGIRRSLGIQSERIVIGRVESEVSPVSCLCSQTFFLNGLAHALLDAVVDTRSISEDEGRSVVSFRFVDSLDSLVEVRADVDAGDIDIAVSHGHTCQILLLCLLAGSSELCDRACRC